LSILQQGNGQDGAPPTSKRKFTRILRIYKHIGDEGDCTIKDRSTADEGAVWLLLLLTGVNLIRRLGCKILGCDDTNSVISIQIDNTENGVTQARGALDDCIKYGLRIRPRTTNNT
jgi:hypothetical protein